MPLKPGKENLSSNISELVRAGHTPSQAIAIALAHADTTEKAAYADGGDVKDDDKKKTLGEIIGYPGSGTPDPKPSPSPKAYADGGYGVPAIPATGEAVAPQDLATLQDMFGKDSSSLGDALTGSRQQALQDVLSKAQAQDIVNTQTLPGNSAAGSAEVLQNAPGVAGGAEASPAQQSLYERLFGKQMTQDAVDAQSVPGKSAADSADVFAKHLPAGEPEVASPNMTPSSPSAVAMDAESLPVNDSSLGEILQHAPGKSAVLDDIHAPLYQEAAEAGSDTAGDALAELLGSGARAIGGPATIAGYEFLKSTPAGEGEDAIVQKRIDDYKKMLAGGGADKPPQTPPAAVVPAPATSPSVAAATASRALAAAKPSGASTSLSAPPAPAATATPAVNPLMQKYLQDRQDMKDAVEKANYNRLIAGMSGAAGQLAASTYASTKPYDAAAFKELADNANAPVANLQAVKDAGMKGIQEQQALIKAQQEQGANDPNSPLSAQIRGVYGPILKKAGLPTDGIATMSANDIKAYAQAPLEFVQKQKELEAQRAMQLEMAKERMMYQQGNMLSGKLLQAQNQMNGEAKKSQEGMAAADAALTNLNLAKTDPVAWTAVPIQVARTMVQGQRINQPELQALGGSKAVLDHLDQIGKQAAEGTISDANFGYFQQVLKAMKDSAATENQSIIKRHVQQWSQVAHKPMTDAYMDMTGNSLPGGPDTATAVPTAKPISPAPGKQIKQVLQNKINGQRKIIYTDGSSEIQ